MMDRRWMDGWDSFFDRSGWDIISFLPCLIYSLYTPLLDMIVCIVDEHCNRLDLLDLF